MNIKRFTARNSREALRLVRDALGDDAVVLSTKPSAGGVEVLALATESIGQLEAMSQFESTAPTTRAAAAELATTSADEDAERLSMSTLSFQDYVRKRMLKRRHAALKRDAAVEPAATQALTSSAGLGLQAEPAQQARRMRLESPASPPALSREREREKEGVLIDIRLDDDDASVLPLPRAREGGGEGARVAPPMEDAVPGSTHFAAETARRVAAPFNRDGELLAELRAVKGLIEERFGALAFMERLQRRPAEARLSQKLLDCGFSPILVRKMADGFKAEAGDETEWAAQILEKNLLAASADEAIEDRGGVFALVGPTGVGKTTTTAKIAAAFAARHGATHLGLITLDAYRVGAHEQLRAYGRILGVPVHTAHDRASLEDLLELLTAKKMVLIDTAGMAQRDTRTRELLDMLSHRSVQRLLVINSAAQGETIEDVLIAYRASSCAGIVLSKLDEAVKLAPALDAAIRHRLTVVGVANGQRVPEDWHRLSAHALVQRALRGGGSAAWRLDAAEMNLIFAAPRGVPSGVALSA